MPQHLNQGQRCCLNTICAKNTMLNHLVYRCCSNNTACPNNTMLNHLVYRCCSNNTACPQNTAQPRGLQYCSNNTACPNNTMPNHLFRGVALTLPGPIHMHANAYMHASMHKHTHTHTHAHTHTCTHICTHTHTHTHTHNFNSVKILQVFSNVRTKKKACTLTCKMLTISLATEYIHTTATRNPR